MIDSPGPVMVLPFAELTPPTTPDRRPTPIDPNFGPTRLTHTGRGASVTHPLDDNFVQPFELPPYDLPQFDLPPFAMPPFEMQPFGLPPFEMQPFAMPPFAMPPFAMQPFGLPPFAMPMFEMQPFGLPLLRCVAACHCLCNSQCRTPAPGQTRCNHCRLHCILQHDESDDDN